MIGRVVITSVPQGLGGGSGFQPVLRTVGLRPSIAERLAMRAAYPHPYAFGNSANPHVLFHRIETVGDRTIHILASVRDAGSSYTGRSNHLAELIAIDPAETQSLPAGPAFAALAFNWLGRWSGEPSEIPLAKEPTVPASDPDDPEVTGYPRACTTWAAIAGDAGWAGALAKSFLDGQSAVIWVEKGDDVAGLFTEAARLLPRSVRWQVTFNTCEIEPFPAHWRALRSDLSVVGPRPAPKDLVLDLATLRKNGQRAPENALSQTARGEAPWRSTKTTPPSPHTGSGHAARDDAALRAHLREIRDDRKRRSRASSAMAGDPPHRTPWSAFASITVAGVVLAAAFLTFFAVRLVLDPGAMPRWFGARFSEVASLDSGLRSSAPPRETNRKSQDTPEVPAAEHLPSENEKETLAPPAHNTQPRPEEDEERQKPDQHQEANHKKQDQERVARQQQAIAVLEENNGRTVVSLPTASEGSAAESDLPPLDLCIFKGCTFTDLVDPTLDIACPYRDKDRLTVELEADGSDNARTWLVKGSLFDRTAGHAGDHAPPTNVCRIHGANDRLWLEPLVREPQNQLLGRLANSVLLIYSREPDENTSGPTRLRRRIYLGDPIDPKAHQFTLDPLGGVPPGSKVTVELLPSKFVQELRDRLREIDPSDLDWSIALAHPALATPLVLDHKNHSVTLKLAHAPTKGVEIRYHRPTSNNAFEERLAYLRLDAHVEFTLPGCLLECTPAIQGVEGLDDKDRAVLKNVFTFKRLADAVGNARKLSAIETAFAKFLIQQDDGTHTILDARLKSAKPEECEGVKKEIADWKQKREKRSLEDSSAAAKSLGAHLKWFGPISIQLRTFRATAIDSQREKYPVEIVKVRDH